MQRPPVATAASTAGTAVDGNASDMSRAATAMSSGKREDASKYRWTVDDVLAMEAIYDKAHSADNASNLENPYKTRMCSAVSKEDSTDFSACEKGPICSNAHGHHELYYFRGTTECRLAKCVANSSERAKCLFMHDGIPPGCLDIPDNQAALKAIRKRTDIKLGNSKGGSPPAEPSPRHEKKEQEATVNLNSDAGHTQGLKKGDKPKTQLPPVRPATRPQPDMKPTGFSEPWGKLSKANRPFDEPRMGDHGSKSWRYEEQRYGPTRERPIPPPPALPLPHPRAPSFNRVHPRDRISPPLRHAGAPVPPSGVAYAPPSSQAKRRPTSYGGTPNSPTSPPGEGRWSTHGYGPHDSMRRPAVPHSPPGFSQRPQKRARPLDFGHGLGEPLSAGPDRSTLEPRGPMYTPTPVELPPVPGAPYRRQEGYAPREAASLRFWGDFGAYILGDPAQSDASKLAFVMLRDMLLNPLCDISNVTGVSNYFDRVARRQTSNFMLPVADLSPIAADPAERNAVADFWSRLCDPLRPDANGGPGPARSSGKPSSRVYHNRAYRHLKGLPRLPDDNPPR